LIVGYDAAPTPTSFMTRPVFSLLVASMIRAGTSGWNTSSSPAARSNASAS
jgi:hypothetical protein